MDHNRDNQESCEPLQTHVLQENRTMPNEVHTPHLHLETGCTAHVRPHGHRRTWTGTPVVGRHLQRCPSGRKAIRPRALVGPHLQRQKWARAADSAQAHEACQCCRRPRHLHHDLDLRHHRHPNVDHNPDYQQSCEPL